MNRINLLKLLKDNAEKPRSWSIQAQGDEVTLYVYDVIGGLFGGVDAEEVARELAQTNASRINVRINSPGGDVFDAVAIKTALQQHRAEVYSQVDGLAASAATTIAMAGDRIEIAESGMFMIHNAWTIALGNRHDMLDTAALLEKVDGNIRRDYMARSGASEEQVTDWMDAESWFTAEEAVDVGLVDAILEAEGDAAQARALARSWNLSAYRNAPTFEEPEPTGHPDKESLERRLALLERISA